MQFRRAPQTQPLHQFMPYIFPRSLKALQASIRLRVVPIHKNPNLRRPPIVRDYHATHANQPNPRIGQFAFHQSLNFLAQSFAYATAMILEPTLLQTPPRIKLMTISENRSRVLAGKPNCLALSWGQGKYRSNNAIGDWSSVVGKPTWLTVLGERPTPRTTFRSTPPKNPQHPRRDYWRSG